MAEDCAKCWFRAKYDANPKSLLGRLWRWHIKFCPGWKKYYALLPQIEKNALAVKYNLK